MGKNLSLARRIKELRRAAEFTQQDLSMASGLSRSYISRLEMGDIVLPSRDRLRALASALNTTMDDLLHAAGFLGTDSGTEAAELPDLRTYLRLKYGIHDPRTCQAIETILEAICNVSATGTTGTRYEDTARPEPREGFAGPAPAQPRPEGPVQPAAQDPHLDQNGAWHG
jgi:transcriptional regulator with XRE-family HTH domain